MKRPCEICSGLVLPGAASSATRSGKMRRLVIGERLVALCEEHARTVLAADVRDVDSLQGLFKETNGQRSAVDRRSPLDRRVFPPRPERRRHNLGRRSRDPLI